MSKFAQVRFTALMLLPFFFLSIEPGVAQPAAEIPENAYIERYRDSWSCSYGFVKSKNKDKCIAISVPVNAHLDPFQGTSWRCNRGFQDQDGACVAITPVANAYLTNSKRSAQWHCERGFREANEQCVAIEVPENGHLTNSAFGRGWDCARGYRAVDDLCIAIQVPENGYLTDIDQGTGWECERGFRASGPACITVEVPANAYLSNAEGGNGWLCERGFKAVGSECEAIQLPPNAHLDIFGNSWVCNDPYLQTSKGCVDR